MQQETDRAGWDRNGPCWAGQGETPEPQVLSWGRRRGIAPRPSQAHPQTKQGPGHWEQETGKDKRGELRRAELSRAGALIPWRHRTDPTPRLPLPSAVPENTARRQEPAAARGLGSCLFLNNPKEKFSEWMYGF